MDININDFNLYLNKFVSGLNLQYVKYSIVFFILFILISSIMFIIGSYVFIKSLAINIDANNVLFYKYNKNSQKILDLYGDHRITKLYIIRQPLSKFINTLLNIITFYNYNKLITETQQIFPYHTKLVFEIKLQNNERKLVSLEKNNSIVISDNFYINNLQETKIVNLKKKNKLTINSILQTTQKRVGIEKFFNWHIYKNNCKGFIKEILITINSYKKEQVSFIFGDICMNKLMNIIVPTEFARHVVNSLVNINNIVEKYVLDNNIFY
jgi:hypothetical protein